MQDPASRSSGQRLGMILAVLIGSVVVFLGLSVIVYLIAFAFAYRA